jgi:hypothetical protein
MPGDNSINPNFPNVQANYTQNALVGAPQYAKTAEAYAGAVGAASGGVTPEAFGALKAQVNDLGLKYAGLATQVGALQARVDGFGLGQGPATIVEGDQPGQLS